MREEKKNQSQFFSLARRQNRLHASQGKVHTWFRFETWFVVLVFLRAIIPVRGALVSSDVIDEEPIFKSKNFVYCV